MRNQDSGFKANRSRRSFRDNDDNGHYRSEQRSDNEMRYGRDDEDRNDYSRGRSWDQDSYSSRAWEQNDDGDLRGGRMNRDARWNEEQNMRDFGRQRSSGEGSYGQPIYGGGEFTGGYGWGGRQPSGNWRGEGGYGSDALGYGRMGNPGLRQNDEQQRMRDWDDDYHHWRSKQLGKFDEDYSAWRDERRQKFADEFDKWRQGRSGNSGNLSSGGTSEAAAKDSRK